MVKVKNWFEIHHPLKWVEITHKNSENWFDQLCFSRTFPLLKLLHEFFFRWSVLEKFPFLQSCGRTSQIHFLFVVWTNEQPQLKQHTAPEKKTRHHEMTQTTNTNWTPEIAQISEVAAVSGMEALGTLALLWQVPDGPRGILRHPIQVKPLQVGMGLIMVDWRRFGLVFGAFFGWKEQWKVQKNL